MVLRVDVVAAALDAVYGGRPEHRVVALTPQGRQLTRRSSRSSPARSTLTLLSARFEGFDERIVEHLATDAVSIGPYVLSGGELPAMVSSTRSRAGCPGALGSEESAARGELLRGARRRARVPALHAAGRVPRLGVPEVLLSGDHARIDGWRREQSRARTRCRVRNPIDRLTHGLPRQWRIADRLGA